MSGGELTSFQGDALFLSHLQADLHPLFAPFCNLQPATRFSRRLWREVNISVSIQPEISRCRLPMAAAQDLYLQLKISEFCERCCVWKISDRHLRSPLNKSTGVPQRSRCMLGMLEAFKIRTEIISGNFRCLSISVKTSAGYGSLY